MNCYYVKLYFDEYIKLKGGMTDKDMKTTEIMGTSSVLFMHPGPYNGFSMFLT